MSAFTDFSKIYDEFKTRFPTHPLNEELMVRIYRGKFPDEQWLRKNTRRMKELMSPVWQRGGSADRDN